MVETREKARAGGQSNEETPLENGMSLIPPVTWTVASSLATGWAGHEIQGTSLGVTGIGSVWAWGV